MNERAAGTTLFYNSGFIMRACFFFAIDSSLRVNIRGLILEFFSSLPTAVCLAPVGVTVPI